MLDRAEVNPYSELDTFCVPKNAQLEGFSLGVSHSLLVRPRGTWTINTPRQTRRRRHPDALAVRSEREG